MIIWINFSAFFLRIVNMFQEFVVLWTNVNAIIASFIIINSLIKLLWNMILDAISVLMIIFIDLIVGLDQRIILTRYCMPLFSCTLPLTTVLGLSAKYLKLSYNCKLLTISFDFGVIGRQRLAHLLCHSTPRLLFDLVAFKIAKFIFIKQFK